jgi:hypothetical protein
LFGPLQWNPASVQNVRPKYQFGLCGRIRSDTIGIFFRPVEPVELVGRRSTVHNSQSRTIGTGYQPINQSVEPVGRLIFSSHNSNLNTADPPPPTAEMDFTGPTMTATSAAMPTLLKSKPPCMNDIVVAPLVALPAIQVVFLLSNRPSQGTTTLKRRSRE